MQRVREKLVEASQAQEDSPGEALKADRRVVLDVEAGHHRVVALPGRRVRGTFNGSAYMWSNCSRNGSPRISEAKLGAPGREQGREQEHAPENDRGQPQGGVVAQPPRGPVKQGAAQVAELKAGGAVNQVVCAGHQRLQMGDGLARQVMVIGEHQVGARRAVKLAQSQHLLPRKACAGRPARTSSWSSSRQADSRCASRSATLIMAHLTTPRS